MEKRKRAYHPDDIISALNEHLNTKKDREAFHKEAHQYTDNDYTYKTDEDVLLFLDAFSASNNINVIVNENEQGFVLMLESDGFCIQVSRNEFNQKKVKFLWIRGEDEGLGQIYEIW